MTMNKPDSGIYSGNVGSPLARRNEIATPGDVKRYKEYDATRKMPRKTLRSFGWVSVILGLFRG